MARILLNKGTTSEQYAGYWGFRVIVCRVITYEERVGKAKFERCLQKQIELQSQSARDLHSFGCVSSK